MVRTKADGCASNRKVIAAQAPRKSLGGAGPSSSSADGGSPAGKGKYAGGNPAVQRPTPEWQKGISTFFTKSDSSQSSSKSSSQGSAASGSSSQEGSSEGSSRGSAGSSSLEGSSQGSAGSSQEASSDCGGE
ncbi:hypothetical protein BsWGS_26526 [Bradybaena similaris]